MSISNPKCFIHCYECKGKIVIHGAVLPPKPCPNCGGKGYVEA